MKSRFNKEDPASDHMLKKQLDLDIDEARLQGQVHERIKCLGRTGSFKQWLRDRFFLQPGRTAIVGISGAFVIGFAIPLDTSQFADDGLLRIALGDTSPILGFWESHR